MDDLSRFCCLNSDCPEYGKRGAGNLTVTSRYGPDKQRRMLRCRTCKARFSERKGTPLFGAHLDPRKIESVLEHVPEGCGVRQTGRLCGMDRKTVARYGRRAGDHARGLRDERVALSPRTRGLQFDEEWSYVSKEEKHRDPADARKGDCWDHVAPDPERRLVLCVVPGRRTAEGVKAVVTDTQRRAGGRALRLITTDEYPAYEAAILDAYRVTVTPPRTGKPVRPKAPFKVPAPDLRCATAVKARQEGRVVKVDFRVVFGSEVSVRAASMSAPVSRAINTAFVEGQNGTDRHRTARKGRETYRFSKDWEFHEAATYFTLYSYDFSWPKRTLRVKGDRGCWQERTPAMSAGLTDHVWAMSEWLTMPAVQ